MVPRPPPSLFALPLLLSLSLSATPAQAKSTRWFRDGAEAVQFPSGQIDVPLYRGPTTRYLPTVEAAIPVGDDLRPVLAALDVAGGWSRISTEAAATLDLEPAFEKFGGDWRRVVVIPEVRIRDIVFVNLNVEVVVDAPGLVLGLNALPEVAVAVLPSEGVVRWVPAKYGATLVGSIGTPIDASAQPAKAWRVELPGGVHVRMEGDGLTLRIPGAMRWGEATVEGTFHLRTDLETSRIAPSRRLPEAVIRGGTPYHDAGSRLGDVWLPNTWIREDAGLSDPSPDFAASLGYDVLYGIDLAVAPELGLVAFRAASAVKWSDATPVSVAYARARYDQEEARAKGTAGATVERPDDKVEIGFQGPIKTEIPLGDPGKPAVRDRNLDLAETLWRAGELKDALTYYLTASQNAGDHCGAHLLLGERRLAWAGSQLFDDGVDKLVLDPLARAAKLWDLWLELDENTREAITAGKDVPAGTLQVWQPPECRVAYGLLAAVDRARGDLTSVANIEVEHLSAHPSIAYSRGLVALSEGRYGGADPLLSVAAAMQAVDPVDLQVAIARAKAGQGQIEEVAAIAKELPGYPTDHPLTTALGLLEAARSMPHPGVITKKLVRADERWVPGQIAHALATGVKPEPWDPALEQRQPGSPIVACQKAVHLALTGQLREATYLLKLERWPGVADWWAAAAVVAALSGDTALRDEALTNLELRFPLLPVGTLGLP